jgi:hypothetical protein
VAELAGGKLPQRHVVEHADGAGRTVGAGVHQRAQPGEGRVADEILVHAKRGIAAGGGREQGVALGRGRGQRLFQQDGNAGLQQRDRGGGMQGRRHQHMRPLEPAGSERVGDRCMHGGTEATGQALRGGGIGVDHGRDGVAAQRLGMDARNHSGADQTDAGHRIPFSKEKARGLCPLDPTKGQKPFGNLFVKRRSRAGRGDGTAPSITIWK